MFSESLFSAPPLNHFQNSDPALRRGNGPSKCGGTGIRSRNPGGLDPMDLDHVASERVFVRLIGHRYDPPIRVSYCRSALVTTGAHRETRSAEDAREGR